MNGARVTVHHQHHAQEKHHCVMIDVFRTRHVQVIMHVWWISRNEVAAAVLESTYLTKKYSKVLE